MVQVTLNTTSLEDIYSVHIMEILGYVDTYIGLTTMLEFGLQIMVKFGKSWFGKMERHSQKLDSLPLKNWLRQRRLVTTFLLDRNG